MKEKLPAATLLLLVANLVVAGFTLGVEQAAYSQGIVPAAQGDVWRTQIRPILTHAFVHIEPFHLLVNLVVLAALGPVVERALGFWKFLILFLGAAWLGGVAHWAIVRSQSGEAAALPLIGASGGIAGLVGYSFLRFFRERVPLFPRVRVPVFAIIGAWIALEIALAIGSLQTFELASSHWSHLGGLVVGVGLAFLFGAGGAVAEDQYAQRLEEAKRRSADALIALTKQRIKERPQDAEALNSLARALIESGRAELARETLVDLALKGKGDVPTVALRLLIENGWASELPAKARIRLADQAAGTDPWLAETTLTSILEEASGDDTADALATLVTLLVERDEPAARRYAKLLRSDHAGSFQADRIQRMYPYLFENS